MDEAIETIMLEGFDSEGGPEIRIVNNGSLELVFNFMPPTWAEEHPKAFEILICNFLRRWTSRCCGRIGNCS